MKDKLTKSEINELKETKDVWNKVAKGYSEGARARLEECLNNKKSPIVEFITEKMPDLNETSKILDVGCGPGHYDVELAYNKIGSEIIGTDISEEMIYNATKLSKEMRLADKLDFQVLTWQELDPEENGFKNKFDLVYATMTPAIKDLRDIKRMQACSKKYCMFVGFSLMENEINDYVREGIMGKDGFWRKHNHEKEYFDYLWDKGFYPEIHFVNDFWFEDFKSVDEAMTHFYNFEKKEDVEKHKKEITEYLKSKLVNGNIHFRTHVIKYYLFWKIQ